MNTLKKIFLLTLLSVFFLSAYSQTSGGTEILAKINIDRSAGIVGFEPSSIGEDPQLKPYWPWWWILYKYVTTEVGSGYMSVTCEGGGWNLCMPLFKEVWNMIKRGVQVQLQPEVAERTLENIITESEELASQGEYRGSLSKKIAIPDDKTNFVLFLMNWNYDPRNPYNGQAEIIISKTDKLGF